MNSKPVCRFCNDTGLESTGVCYCGDNIEGHSLYDNHMATEMMIPCENCPAGMQQRDALRAKTQGHILTISGRKRRFRSK